MQTDGAKHEKLPVRKPLTTNLTDSERKLLLKEEFISLGSCAKLPEAVKDEFTLMTMMASSFAPSFTLSGSPRALATLNMPPLLCEKSLIQCLAAILCVGSKAY